MSDMREALKADVLHDLETMDEHWPQAANRLRKYIAALSGADEPMEIGGGGADAGRRFRGVTGVDETTDYIPFEGKRSADPAFVAGLIAAGRPTGQAEPVAWLAFAETEACRTGRVCDDVAWYSKIETLFDFCDAMANSDRDRTDDDLISLVEQNAKLTARLATIEQETRWQPIETIPKDGTSVLVTMAGGFDGPYYVLFWNDSFFESVDSGEGPSIDHLTHWMSLPQPPLTSPNRSEGQ